MNINEAFPSNYLKAQDLQGREVQVTISNVAMEKLGSDTRMILYFQGKQKGMVCNKTNAMNIAMMYGEDTDGWLGKSVTLFSAWVDFQGKSVQGLRVRPGNGAPLPQQRATQAQAPAQGYGPPQGHPADLDDEVPF
jgi:hypothetical protein